MRRILPVAALALAAASASVVFAIRAREAMKTATLEADRAAESSCQVLESQGLAVGLLEQVKDLKSSRSRARKSRDRAESELEEAQVRLRRGERERDSLHRSLRLVRGESTLLPDFASGGEEYAEPGNELSTAYKDITEMERQLIDVSRAKNVIEQQLAFERWNSGGHERSRACAQERVCDRLGGLAILIWRPPALR